MKTNKCPECGRGKIEPRGGPGRRMAYRQIRDLELPADLLIPTCDNCGEQWLDAKATAAVDAALRSTYEAVLVRKSVAAIDTLKQPYTQQELERLVGLSAGYLSKLKNGKETTAPLAALLMLLANDSSRVEELRACWSAQATPSAMPIPEFNIDSVHSEPDPIEAPVIVLPKPSAPSFVVDPAGKVG